LAESRGDTLRKPKNDSGILFFFTKPGTRVADRGGDSGLIIGVLTNTIFRNIVWIRPRPARTDIAILKRSNKKCKKY